MPSPARIQALLLDLDGTVADTHDLIHQCLDETARAHLGVGFPRALWARHVGIPLADLFSLVRPADAHSAPTVDVLVDSYRQRQERDEHRLRAFPGIASVLAVLRRRGVRLAIVTTKLHAVAQRHVAAIGLATGFDALVGFDDCLRAKPDAEPFRKALQALAVPPTAAAAVGDSPVDIHGARAAGATTIAALWGTADRGAVLAAHPDHVLDTPEQLLHLFTPEDGA